MHKKSVDLEALFKAAVEIGYQGVDLAKPEYFQMIRDQGLELSAIEGHKSILEGMNRRRNHDRIVQELEEKIELAAKWGIPNIICFSGSRAGQPDIEGIENSAACLRRVAKSARRRAGQPGARDVEQQSGSPGLPGRQHAVWGSALRAGRLTTGEAAV